MSRIFYRLCLFMTGLAAALWEQAAAKTSGSSDAVLIHNTEQFNRHLENLALKMQTRTMCAFKKPKLIHAQNICEQSFWYDYGNTYKATIYPKHVASFEFQFKDNARLLAAHTTPALHSQLSAREQAALTEARRRVQTLLTPDMTDSEKFRALHDDLIERGRYTQEQKGDAADLLIDGIGTCEAYSRALWLLCRMSNIPCHIVYGQAGEPHAWNLVQLDGQWYHTDATWDDPVNIDNPYEGILSHRYFMLNDQQMSLDHSWAQGCLPAATAKNAEFFIQQKLYFTNDSALWETLERTIKEGHGSLEVYMSHYNHDTAFQQRLQEATRQRPLLQQISAWQGPNKTGAGVVRFTFINAGDPPAAGIDNLDFSSGIIIETRRLLEQIDTKELLGQLNDLSHKATDWWSILVEFLRRLWAEICRHADCLINVLAHQDHRLWDEPAGTPASCESW